MPVTPEAHIRVYLNIVLTACQNERSWNAIKWREDRRHPRRVGLMASGTARRGASVTSGGR
jgi:hypothetical protein